VDIPTAIGWPHRKTFAARAWRSAIGIGLLYLAISAVWVLGSDRLVESIAPNPQWLATVKDYKRLGYVVASALVLVWLVHRSLLRMFGAIHRATEGALTVQDLFAHHPKPMWVFDQRTLKFLSVNEAAVRHYGYSEAEFLAMSLHGIRADEDVPHMLSLLSEPVQDHRDIGILQHRKRNGELIVVHSTLHPLQFMGKAAVLVVVDDVTAQTRARQALEQQEAQFRQLHQSLEQVLWLAAPDGSKLYVSPASARVYGVEPDARLGDAARWADAVLPADRAAWQQSFVVLTVRGRSECEYRIVRADGTTRWVCEQMHHIVDAQGRLQMIGGCVEDVTERRTANELLEARVRERTKELQFLNQELDAFSRTAAHDLKTPLNAISGLIQLLQLKHDTALGADGQRLTMHMDQAARGMSALVNDLLALSRVSMHELQPTRVCLSEMAHHIVAELRAREPARHVDFIAPRELQARADARLMRSLLTNLLDNAWKYSSKRTDAVIAMGHEVVDGRAVFFVRDNGAGFDPALANKLFKPFQRLHAMSDFHGTGVGLSTCQRIVGRHGGEIWAESVPGQGSTFYFTLAPRASIQRNDSSDSTRSLRTPTSAAVMDENAS
jgi:PAS domain S-box-containing protein